MTTGDGLRAMPMSPRQSPAEIRNAILNWARSRRGRTLGIVAVFFLVVIGLLGVRHSDVGIHSLRKHTEKYLSRLWGRI
jgi:hypothetical protein